MRDHDVDEEEGDTPEWPLRWTVWPVLTVILLKDLIQAFADFWSGVATHLVAFHNRRVQQLNDMDEIRAQIESIPEADDDGQ